MEILSPLWLSFKLSIIAVPLLLLTGVPAAYFLAFSKSRFKHIWEAVVSLPLVLPPSVIGFYLVLLFSPNGYIGSVLKSVLDVQLLFSFPILVIGAVIFNFPFMVNSIKAGFESIPAYLIEASYTLGKSKKETLLKIMIPNIKPAFLTGIVLCFAHTVGEFGVILMIGGNIPGSTRVASVAIYNEVEALNYNAAHFHSLILLSVSFIMLLILYTVNRKYKGF
ncbi:TPA: molybdate ABC transporter permease subunit [Candidatus Delongbacteria bacterium]|nr:molybdate ABC transporter permease subunit [Candidatus Delongbacteria bacterium]